MAENTQTPKTRTINLNASNFQGGTYTYAPNAGNPTITKTAAADTTVLTIPIDFSKSDNNLGMKLKSIIQELTIGTAAITSQTHQLYQVPDNSTYGTAGTGTRAAGVLIATTNDGSLAVSTGPKDITVTVTNQAYDGSLATQSAVPTSYVLISTFVAAATSTMVWGGKAYTKFEEIN